MEEKHHLLFESTTQEAKNQYPFHWPTTSSDTDQIMDQIKKFLIQTKDWYPQVKLRKSSSWNVVDRTLDGHNFEMQAWNPSLYMGCFPGMKIASLQPEFKTQALCDLPFGTYTWVMFLSLRSSEPKLFLAMAPNMWHVLPAEIFGAHPTILSGIAQRFPGSIAFLGGEAFVSINPSLDTSTEKRPKSGRLRFNLSSGRLTLPILRAILQGKKITQKVEEKDLEIGQKLFWIPLATFLWKQALAFCEMNWNVEFVSGQTSLLQKKPVSSIVLRKWFCDEPACLPRLEKESKWDSFRKSLRLDTSPLCEKDED
jgi:hypothetical protein